MKKTKLLLLPLVALLASCGPNGGSSTQIDVPGGYEKLPSEESERLIPKFAESILGLNTNFVIKEEDSLKLNLNVAQDGLTLVHADVNMTTKSVIGLSYTDGYEIQEGYKVPSIYFGLDEMKGSMKFTVEDLEFNYTDINVSLMMYYDAVDVALFIDFGDYKLIELAVDVLTKAVSLPIDKSTLMSVIKMVFNNKSKVKLDLDGDAVIELLNKFINGSDTDVTRSAPELKIDKNMILEFVSSYLLTIVEGARTYGASIIEMLAETEYFDVYKNDTEKTIMLLGNHLGNKMLEELIGVELGSALNVDAGFMVIVDNSGDKALLKSAEMNAIVKANNFEVEPEEGVKISLSGQVEVKSKSNIVFEDCSSRIQKNLFTDVSSSIVGLVETILSLIAQ